jgi:hypothetical protein
VPEHETSVEERWLWSNYTALDEYPFGFGPPDFGWTAVDLRGRWIAVLGEQVIDHDPDPRALVERVSEELPDRNPLFAFVASDQDQG